MAKKLISVWLSLTILLFSSISIYAGDNVQGRFFFRNITINGQQINNYNMDNPAFLYGDATYLPLDSDMCNILGVKAELDPESRTLKLWKADSTQVNLAQPWMKNNGENISALTADGVKAVAYEPAEKTTGAVSDSSGAEKSPEASAESEESPETSADDNGESEEAPVIQAPELNAAEINLKGLPLLSRGNVFYVPVTAVADSEVFGWDVYYDSYSGIYISTKEGVSAKSFFNEPESRYNRGLANYIRQYNGSYTESKAQELVFLFKHEADVFDMDVTLLLSVARRESTFNPSAKSSAGAVGMMQIMPATAARYGISVTQLYDPHVNVELGTRYLSERFSAYNGNAVVALSSYNQGSGAISRGGYSTRYASNILDTKSGLEYYLQANGYGTGN